MALALSILGGCATLPSSGPTGAQIVRSIQAEEPRFDLVELTDSEVLALPQPSLGNPALPAADPTARPSDLIGAGDVLDIAIYEVGVKLFGGGAAAAVGGDGFNPSAGSERLPSLRVDDDGLITIPFVGRIVAAGKTPAQLQREIASSLAGKSQLPQILVRISEPLSSSIIINGEVQKPGRFPLSARQETLGDMVALAGGYRGQATDLAVQLERNGQVYEDRLSSILQGGVRDVRLMPGDRVNIVLKKRTFTLFGGAKKVDQYSFDATTLSLAEAIGRAGGSDTYQGDPAAIFVFRFPQDPAAKPTVYHLNMMKPESYFLAQKFALQDKDVLYVGNARANQPSKLIQIISQLFTPVVLARQLTQ